MNDNSLGEKFVDLIERPHKATNLVAGNLTIVHRVTKKITIPKYGVKRYETHCGIDAQRLIAFTERDTDRYCKICYPNK